MSKLQIRTKLLEALAECAADMQSGASRIAGIVFRDNEIIATNGHLLVRVEKKHELNLMVPTELARAACAASLSGDDGQVDEFGYPVHEQSVVYVFADGGDAAIDVGGAVLRAAALDMSKFPDGAAMAKCTEKCSADGNPRGVLFDPAKVALAGEVARAHDLRGQGMRIVECGGEKDPIVFDSSFGVRAVLMPMEERK